MTALNFPLTWLSSILVAVAVALGAVSAGPAWDSISQRYLVGITPSLVALRIDRRQLSTWLRWWGISLIAVFLFVYLVMQMLLPALLAVYFVYAAPRILLNLRVQRRARLLRDQLTTACGVLANTTRAGLSLGQSIAIVGQETPQPLAAEIQRIGFDFQNGRPLSDAIRDAKDHLKLESFTLFSSALLVSVERGGRITEALDEISVSLRENQRLERKIEADTAAGSRVVVILTLFPLGFLAFFYLLDPTTTTVIFRSLAGQVVLVIAALLVYVAAQWSAKIINIRV